MQRSRQAAFCRRRIQYRQPRNAYCNCKAAQKLKAPVLVEVSHGEVEAIGLENIRDMVDNYRKEYGIEMYINLDHSPSVEACKRAIDEGYEFIHIDISQANHDATDQEIIRNTKEVVEYAKFTGALVESEPHYFGGSSNVHEEAIDYEEIKKTFSVLQKAQDDSSTQQESIHLLPLSVTCMVNIQYRKNLTSSYSRRIHEAMPEGKKLACMVALAHPCITLKRHQRLVSARSISILICAMSFRKTLEKVLADNPDEYAVVKLMPTVYEAVQTVVEEKIHRIRQRRKGITSNDGQKILIDRRSSTRCIPESQRRVQPSTARTLHEKLHGTDAWL